MDLLFNTAKKNILIKDMSCILDFKLIDSEFNKLEYTKNIDNFISNDFYFLDKPIFNNIKDILTKECEDFLRNGHGVNMFENLKITNSWGNMTTPGQSHHKHNHPFSIVSGVLYLDNNPDNLNLSLETYFQEIPYFINRENTYSSIKKFIPNPEECNNLKNHLILFLSNTGHCVEQINSTSNNRRSIAFNTFWKGLTGSHDNYLGSMRF